MAGVQDAFRTLADNDAHGFLGRLGITSLDRVSDGRMPCDRADMAFRIRYRRTDR